MTVAQPSSSARSPRPFRPALPHDVPMLGSSSPQPPIVVRPSAPLNSRPLILLQTLCRREKSQLLCNQANPNSLDKTPWGGIPYQEIVYCTKAQKRPSVSPLLATLTHSASRKSFPCHSYENTRDGRASAPPRHPLLGLSHALHSGVVPPPAMSGRLLFKRGPRYSFPCAGRKTVRRSALRQHQPPTQPSPLPAAARARSAPNGIRQ